MKNVYLGIFLILLSNYECFGQSKKEQINTLNYRVDSLLTIISNQSNLITKFTNNLLEQNEILSKKEKELQELQRDLTNYEIEIKVRNIQINKLSKSIDSLKVLLLNAYSHSNIDWSKLETNYEINGFKLSNIGELTYHDKSFSGEIALNRHDNIMVSPLSGNKKYSFCFSYEGQYSDYSRLYLFNHETMSSKKIDIMYPLLWLSWSPNVDYVILGRYYEADMALFTYNITQNTVIELDFSKDVKKEDGFWVEEIRFDLDNLVWVSDTTFSVVVNIHCNPYVLEDLCDNAQRKVVLRSYKYIYDIDKNLIINTILNN